jgi:RHS repeat-associated protein
LASSDAAGAGTLTRQYDGGDLEPGAGEPGYAYTGREWDPETGPYYYRARYYDPKSGRFISEDPIGFQGGVNFYSYVDNQPAHFTDPFGLVRIVAGADFSWIKVGGVDAGAGYYVDSKDLSFGSFKYAGPSLGLNISAQAFVGWMSSEAGSTTGNWNGGMGPGNACINWNDKGDIVGSNVGLGLSVTPASNSMSVTPGTEKTIWSLGHTINWFQSALPWNLPWSGGSR